ncbi:5'-AMP-activated serine/threonine-protein kinase catalytic subunit alpha-like isoform X2 [Metopolophium dirhodum]|nr:5'-AMP-activated serine/threonine-protein kinase catalytic subunit alpha-like isoform X2 [Metopolophium dirhodum]
MDSEKFMDEVRSLHLKLDCVTETLSSLDKKINEINESQQIGAETVRKSANSINIIIRFLAGLRKLSHEELKNTLVEADAILNTVNPIPTNQNLDETLEWNVTKDTLKTILKEVFDLLSSLPLDTKVNANNPVASTSIASGNNKVEEKKIQFWRRYKNKYNYIEKLKPKLPPIKNPAEEVVSLQDGIVENDVNPVVENDVNPIVENDVNPIVQNDENSIVQNYENSIVQNDENSIVQNDENSIVQNDENSIVQNDENSIVQNDENSIVQNDLNDNTQNSVNDTAQNDLNNETTYTLNDIIQNEEVYELFKSKLKNSPYEEPCFQNNVRNSKLTLKLHNGVTIVRPVSHVAPLIVLKKCDDICPIPLQKKNPTDEHFQSTSNYIYDSNSNNTTAQRTKKETRANKTNNTTNSVNTNVETTTKKRKIIKNRKYEPSKKNKK